MSTLTDQEIIKILGGPAAVARLVNVKPPSVQGWLIQGIPEGRLIELGAEIERRAPDRFSRRERWPDRYTLIWPELSANDASHPEPTTEQEAV
jgi:hypothetical protein